MVSTQVTLVSNELSSPINSSSEKPASPPPTPPPVFSLPKLAFEDSGNGPVSSDEKSVNQFGEEGVDDYAEDVDKENLSEAASRAESLLETDGVDENDDELTEPGDDSDVPASIFSSPRSSILSFETLCDTIDVPGKRSPFVHSRTQSFDIFGKQSPPISIRPSRTVSFSEPLVSLIPFPVPPTVDPLTISLPPSPVPSVDSSHSPLSYSSESPKISLSSNAPLPSQLEDEPSIVRPYALIIPKRGISLFSPLSLQDEDDCDSSQYIRSTSVTETASYIVTGFLVGAFLTLFLFSTQRRTLLYVT